MLVRAVKPNFDGLQEAAKQLLIWTLSRKQGIHHTCQNHTYYGYKRRPVRRRYDNTEFYNFSKKPALNLQDLPEIEKKFYVPHPNVVNRPESETKSFYEKNEIKIFGNCREQSPAPIFSFEELDLEPETLKVIRDLDYSEPTPIQSVTWPVALSGLNMVGVAQTGSGKTLGFALPGVIHIKHQPSLGIGKGPIAVVISPTRELAQQTNRVFLPFAKSCSLRTSCVFGGASKSLQMPALERAHICIATPGRLIDFLQMDFIDLKRCSYFVLDEADRLLDMGFEPQIRSIMSQMRPNSQILMWSATWPTEVEHLASDILNDYLGVRFGSEELSANPNITQRIHVCDFIDKRKMLLKILREVFQDGDNKTLVFAQTKEMVRTLFFFLRNQGYSVAVVHGDMNQNKRDSAIEAFRSGRVQLLVGTLIVGRGLDITDIKHVINYDFPTTVEDYVHLIGRTGRCNNEGTAHTLVTPQDARFVNDLIKILNQTNQEVNPDLLNLTNDRNRRRYSNMYGRNSVSRRF